MNVRCRHHWLILVFLLSITGCTTTPTPTALPPIGSCILNLDAAIGDEAAIEAVLAAEGTFVVNQSIVQLMQLWAEGSFVADAGNTPNQTDDDQLWRNKDAIRNRYVRIVFPGAPTSATPADLVITLNGAQAIVSATTQIGSELSPAGDRWELIKQDGCWLIQSLTYNLEPVKSQ